MLLLRLYKGVILNNTYQNVFSLGKIDGKSILEKYLETKDYYDIECPNVYYENKGEFVVDYELFDNNVSNIIYDFNYVKVIEMDENKEIQRLIRYCFINSIKVKNGCVYLEYQEDVWSSYSDKIHGITESYLMRSRVFNYEDYLINLKSLPKEYDGNDALNLVQLTTGNTDIGWGVQIILECQLYDLHEQGEETTRWSQFYQYGDNNSTTGVEYRDSYKYFSYDNAIKRLIYKILPAVSISATSAWYPTASGLQYPHKFVIGNIYIVPGWFNLRTQTAQNIQNYGCRIINYTGYNFEGTQYTGGTLLTINDGVVYEKIIDNDYKNIGIGLLTNNIQIKNNGTPIKLSISMVHDNFSIHFYMNVLNQCIEITNDFLCDIPYSIITSEELSQHKMTLQMKDLNFNYAVQKLQYKNVEAVGRTAAGAMQIAGYDYAKGLMNEVGGLTDLFTNLEEQKRLKEENALNHAPIYSYNKGTFTNKTNQYNSEHGIILLQVVPDNEEFVKKFINNFGYVVYEFINTEKFELLDLNGYQQFADLGANYNVVRFDSANVYGSFPREISETLDEILETGVKIWYDYQMNEDNYVV